MGVFSRELVGVWVYDVTTLSTPCLFGLRRCRAYICLQVFATQQIVDIVVEVIILEIRGLHTSFAFCLCNRTLPIVTSKRISCPCHLLSKMNETSSRNHRIIIARIFAKTPSTVLFASFNPQDILPVLADGLKQHPSHGVINASENIGFKMWFYVSSSNM